MDLPHPVSYSDIGRKEFLPELSADACMIATFGNTGPVELLF
jgi:hypothetical protein